MVQGVPVSPGIAFGKALVLPQKQYLIMKRMIEHPSAEQDRFRRALAKAKAQIDTLIETSRAQGKTESAEIFAAHRLILEDPEFIASVERQIVEEKVNAEFALETSLNFYINLLSQTDNPYLKERVADLKDVGHQVLHFLAGEHTFTPLAAAEQCIIVAYELAPSDTAQLQLDIVQGFITELGGATSHTAIIARSLELPAVVGVEKITTSVQNGDRLIVDGETGTVYINPDQPTIDKYRQKQAARLNSKAELTGLKNAPAQTQDGKKISLLANVGEPWELAKALEYGAAGIGLYRTEYLFMNKESLPSEEEQFQAYKEVLTKMEGKPVVIRTLDIGGDKKLSYLPLEYESNPFLGCRAIRLCLKHKELFTTQLRALYRASSYGRLKIMFPMVSSLEEYREARALAEGAKAALRKEGYQIDHPVPLGIMVELPSTAVIADLFAQEVDFFSIGTNDLIQYTLAVDRMNERISHLYSPFHPAVLRLIQMVIDQSRRAGIEVSMCGEMAGEPRLTALLLGLGLTTFSMSPAALLAIKKELSGLKMKKAKSLAQKALRLPTSHQVEELIRSVFHA